MSKLHEMFQRFLPGSIPSLRPEQLSQPVLEINAWKKERRQAQYGDHHHLLESPFYDKN